ncbi:MAG TPA: hypothetical protein VLJ19_16475 [Variovorax sp.]|nr:hypothetical protein [Variovorax sp.]
MPKHFCAWLICGLFAGCATSTPPGYSICNTRPGSYECQVEQYQNVDTP